MQTFIYQRVPLTDRAYEILKDRSDIGGKRG